MSIAEKTAPTCPPWCTSDESHRRPVHEAVVARFGTYGAPVRSEIAVEQWVGVGAVPTARLWVFEDPALVGPGRTTNHMDLTAEQAEVLARVVAALQSWEDVKAFTDGLVKAAQTINAVDVDADAAVQA